MKKAVIIPIVVIVLIFILANIFNSLGFFGPYIEQDVSKGAYDYQMKIWTYIWYQGEIVWTRCDPLDTMTDSIMNVAQKEAQEFSKMLKNLK